MIVDPVESSVRAAFQAAFPDKDLSALGDDTPIVDGIGLSSLDIIRLFAQLENTFDIDLINNIDPDQVGRYRLKDLSDIVQQMKEPS